MGRKGARLTSGAESAAAAFVARVAAIGDVTSKKMFGGLGIFESGTMFGIVDSTGMVFLRGGVTNEARFETAGSQRHGKMPYFAIPDDVLGDDAAVVEWARLAAQVARDAKKR
jgi:DNA transformation protein